MTSCRRTGSKKHEGKNKVNKREKQNKTQQNKTKTVRLHLTCSLPPPAGRVKFLRHDIVGYPILDPGRKNESTMIRVLFRALSSLTLSDTGPLLDEKIECETLHSRRPRRAERHLLTWRVDQNAAKKRAGHADRRTTFFSPISLCDQIDERNLSSCFFLADFGAYLELRVSTNYRPAVVVPGTGEY